jgi:hypothetical protein
VLQKITDADISKVKSKLGHTPKFVIENGINRLNLFFSEER